MLSLFGVYTSCSLYSSVLYTIRDVCSSIRTNVLAVRAGDRVDTPVSVPRQPGHLSQKFLSLPARPSISHSPSRLPTPTLPSSLVPRPPSPSLSLGFCLVGFGSRCTTRLLPALQAGTTHTMQLECPWAKSPEHILQHFAVDPSRGLTSGLATKHAQLYGKNGQSVCS